MDAKQKRDRTIDWLAFWILFSSWCSVSGWGLSAVGCLNRAGYVIAFGLFGMVVTLWGTNLGLWSESARRPLRLLQSRFIIPRIWLTLTILIAIGGLLYHPNNFDYLTYRFPRVLHWWWDQKWHWITTVNGRMNYSGTGFEWIMTPLFVFFKTDRLFFLINLISYLLLPGLVFSVFRGLGISGRVSWWWMWVLPSGYCYALQAASAGNDSFAAVYALASLHYALRKGSDSTANITLSTLSVALLTGAKASNLPLVLPWLIAVFFHRTRLFSPFRPGVLLGLLAIAALISFLPMALLNIRFTGDYSGDPQNIGKMKLTNPVSGMTGNGIELIVANLALPVWPKKMDWEPILPHGITAWVQRDFPRCNMVAGEMQIEETAGVGLGITLFAVLTMGLGLSTWKERSRLWSQKKYQACWIVAGVAIALLVYMCKIGSESGPRLIAAYYPLGIAGLLVVVSPDGIRVKRKLYQAVGLIVIFGTFPLVLLNPARPLFPVQIVETGLEKFHVPASLISRYDQVYGVYASRFEGFRSLQDSIPATERAVGFIQNGNNPEASLWRPFGSRQIIDVTPNQTREDLMGENIRVIVIGQDALEQNYHLKISDLIREWSAQLVAQKEMTLLAQRGPETWYVISL